LSDRHSAATRPTRRRRLAVFCALLVTAATLSPAGPIGWVGQVDASGHPACGTGGTPAVTTAHNRHFYIDSGQSSSLFSQYGGYAVRAGGDGGEGLWIELSDFTGGIVRLADGQTPRQALPALASGASTMAYFLLTADQSLASGGSGIPQTHTITIYQGSPSTGGVALCSRTFTYSDVRETIKALANKVQSIDSSSVGGGSVALGDAVVITVEGTTGTLGSGPADDPGVLDFTPNALADFPAAAWRLERTELTISPNGSAPAVTYVDRLYLSGASGPNRPYTARYTFRAVGPTAIEAQVKPIQYIASGTQVKHTDLGSTPLYLLPSVSSVANVWLAKSADPTVVDLGLDEATEVDYTLTLTNAGGSPGVIDEVVDTVPTGATLVPGSARLDGGYFAEPAQFGDTVVFRGPIRVPASGQARITYQLDLGDQVGARTNTAVAYYVQNVIDSSRDVLHSEPATAVVRVRDGAGEAPEAVDDVAGTAANTSVTVDVLTNDVSPSELALHVESFTQPAASAGTVTRAGDQLVFTPGATFAGRTTFTYVVSDGTSTDTATVTVDVSPLANDDSYAGPPGAALSPASSVLVNDGCPGCDVSLVTGPAVGTLQLNANGTFTYTPPDSTARVVTFTYRATLPSVDGGYSIADSDTATATITLANVAPDARTTPYATSVDIAVIANDSCGLSNPICQVQNSIAVAPTNGTTAQKVPNNQSVRYTPYATVGNVGGATPFWGIDRFQYTTTAGGGNGAVTVLVGPPSVAMTAVSGGDPVGNNLATGVCSGCTLAFSVAAAPGHGTVSMTTAGLATYTPPSGWSGDTSFTYTVREPVSGLAVVGSVNVTVGPEAVDDRYSTTFGVQVAGQVADNDTCQGSCTVTLASPPSTGTLDIQPDGGFTYVNASGVGDVSFAYQLVSDAAPGVVATATVTITVVGTADDLTVTDFAAPVTIDVQGNDPCQACTITHVSTPSVGSVVLEGDGSVTYTAPDSFSGRATFTYTVELGGGTSTATVSVDVRPAAFDDVAFTLMDTPTVVLPLANDLCSNCSIAAVGGEQNGAAEIRPDGRSVRFTPADGFTGVASFDYTLIDGNGSTASATVTVTVAAPPSLADDAVQTDAATPVVIDVADNDDCDGCALSIEADPTSGSVSLLVDGTILYLSGTGFSGIDTFTYRATDPETGSFGTAVVTVTVAPVALDDVTRTATGTPVDVDVRANDACGDCSLVVVEDAAPEAGITEIVDGMARFTPEPAFEGDAVFRYRVTDTVTGLFAEATVLVVVDDAQPDAIATPHGVAVDSFEVLANDSCVDCEIVAVSQVAAGVSSFVGSTVGFAPAEGFTGLAVFSYTAEPVGGGSTVSSTVTVLVGPPDQTVAVPPGDDPTNGVVLPDDDCDTCGFSVFSPPEHGEIDLDASGAFAYTPPDGDHLTDQLVYRVTDQASGVVVDGLVTFTPNEASALVVAKQHVGTDDAVVAPEGRLDAGDELHYVITVTNTGAVPIAAVVVSDPAATSVVCAGADDASPDVIDTLDAAASIDCAAVVSVSQDHLDVGAITNVASASADEGAIVASSPPVVTSLGQAPALELTKLVAAGSAGIETCTTAQSSLEVDEDDLVTWCFSVTNTGNVTLTTVAIDDPTLGLAPDATSATLLSGSPAIAPGASLLMAAEEVAVATVTNTATAVGSTETELTATSSESSATITVAASAPTTTTSTTTPTTTTDEPEDTTTTTSTTTSTTVAPTTSTTTSTTVAPTTSTTTTTTAAPTPVPTTTTTPTSTSTTVPAAAPTAGATGDTGSAIAGIVWFDRNTNGLLDPGEWPLPGVSVTLSQVAAFSGGGSGGLSLTTVTGPDGRYAFLGMAPGSYTVVAAVTLAGFSPRGNTHGGQSWQVEVELPAGSVADASYYGIGHGQLGGTVFESSTRQPTSFASVSCIWAGLDDSFGTADDVEMTLTADRDGRFRAPGVPYGEFRCRGIDPATGRASTPALVSVWSADLVNAALPITGTLPRTGGGHHALATWAGLLVILGLGAVAVSRRPAPRAQVRRIGR
jgi:large repetitive protein